MEIAGNVGDGPETEITETTQGLDKHGPYNVSYTRNGRHVLIGGRKGHIATFDWQSGSLGCELFVNETIRDVCWLHNSTMFAVAQKKFAYIYDDQGTEIQIDATQGPEIEDAWVD